MHGGIDPVLAETSSSLVRSLFPTTLKPTNMDKPTSVDFQAENARIRNGNVDSNHAGFTLTVHVNLLAGANRIKATATTRNGGPNVDKITVV
jgi:hypothetical protein